METTADAPISSSKAYQVGWTVGGGIEYSINPDWSAKIEYLYADFGKERYNHDGGGGFNLVDTTVSTVRVGLNYHGPVLERLIGR